MTRPILSDIEIRAEQLILQMVRYWSENSNPESEKYEDGAVDSGGMHIPYRIEISKDGEQIIKSDVSGTGQTQPGFYKESFES